MVLVGYLSFATASLLIIIVWYGSGAVFRVRLLRILIVVTLNVQGRASPITFVIYRLIATWKIFNLISGWSWLRDLGAAFALVLDNVNCPARQTQLLCVILLHLLLLLLVFFGDQTPLIELLKQDGQKELEKDVLANDDQRNEVNQGQSMTIASFTRDPRMVEVNR